MAEIIAWFCQHRVRALADKIVPDTSPDATKPGFVAGICGFLGIVSAANGRNRIQIFVQCKSHRQLVRDSIGAPPLD